MKESRQEGKKEGRRDGRIGAGRTVKTFLGL